LGRRDRQTNSGCGATKKSEAGAAFKMVKVVLEPPEEPQRWPYRKKGEGRRTKEIIHKAEPMSITEILGEVSKIHLTLKRADKKNVDVIGKPI